MQITYLELGLSLNRVKENAGISTPEKDAIIVDLLQVSAGSTSEHPKVYRPHLVAALILEQDINRQVITEADGVKFTNYQGVIASLRGMQAALDASLSLVVPLGFLAVAPIAPKVNQGGSQTLFNRVVF